MRMAARLVLGTVQLGQLYGASNRTGLPSESAAIALVRTAIQHGVRCLDTARAYGDAERRIGLALTANLPYAAVVTKLSPLAHLAPDASETEVIAAVAASLAESRMHLGRDLLNSVLLHRAHHRLAWGGSVWQHLRQEREARRIGRLGVSVQTPDETLEALSDPLVQHLQLPFNLLDYRWQSQGVIDALAARSDVVVHVRSVFLQGLLTCDPDTRWPVVPGLVPRRLTDRLQALTLELGRQDPLDLCLAYVRGQLWVHGIVVGMETLPQVVRNVELFQLPPLSAEDCRLVQDQIGRVPEMLLDPASWPTERCLLKAS